MFPAPPPDPEGRRSRAGDTLTPSWISVDDWSVFSTSRVVEDTATGAEPVIVGETQRRPLGSRTDSWSRRTEGWDEIASHETKIHALGERRRAPEHRERAPVKTQVEADPGSG